MLKRRHVLMGLAPVAVFLGVARRGGGPGAEADVATPKDELTGLPREIEDVYAAPRPHWVGDGFRVAGYFSSIPDAARKLSPFVLLDYHPSYDYDPTSSPRGVGVHPHRGFETVTIAWKGAVAHHDSTGSGGVIGPGDVQWMTAASGILHKEYHEQSFARQGGPLQMAQLWVNLPKAHKTAPPRYQPIVAGEMGIVTLPASAGRVRVIAGEYQGVRGPANTFTPMNVLDLELSEGGEATFVFPATDNAALLVMEGALTINGVTRVKQDDFVVFKNAGERVTLQASAKAHVLLLSGEPIAEPMVQHGPFVMNTREEIRQAYADLRAGKFGHLDG